MVMMLTLVKYSTEAPVTSTFRRQFDVESLAVQRQLNRVIEMAVDLSLSQVKSQVESSEFCEDIWVQKLERCP